MEFTNVPLTLKEKIEVSLSDITSRYPAIERRSSQDFFKVRGILSKLLKQVKLPGINKFQINILEDSEVNAGNVVEGDMVHLVVNSGSLQMNDGGIANQLGHELGHVKLNVGDDTEDDQVKADVFGTKLALAAGFPAEEVQGNYETYPEFETSRREKGIQLVKELTS